MKWEPSDSSSIIELFKNQNYTKGLESLINNSITQKTEKEDKNTKRYLPHI